MRGIVIGLVEAAGLGDLVQYLTAALLVRMYTSAKVYLSIPRAFLAKVLLRGCLNNNGIELCECVHLGLRLMGKKNLRIYGHHVSTSYAYVTMLVNRISKSRLWIEVLNPAITKMKSREKYDFGVLGGHSVDENAVVKGGFLSALTFYNSAKYVSTGPSITFPISITPKVLKLPDKYINMFRRALGRLDAIFVRGYTSLDTIRKMSDNVHVFIAPDSTLALSIFFNTHSSRERDYDKIRVVIVPRKEYFVTFSMLDRYKVYILQLARTVRDLLERFDSEIILLSHYAGFSSDFIAIKNLIEALRGVSTRVKICMPTSLLEDIRVISSADVIITGRLHAGLIGMSYGKAVLFTLPTFDVRLHDIFSLLSLDVEPYLIDICSKDSLKNIPSKVFEMINYLKYYSYKISCATRKAMSYTAIPAKTILKFVREVKAVAEAKK